MPSTKPIEVADAEKIFKQSWEQLMVSRQFKRTRMAQIKESEDLYHGIAEKNIRNPFSECFPFMAGYVDHLKSKIDDDSNLVYVHDNEADLKKSLKVSAFYNKVSKSSLPNDSWPIKHRYAKTNAIFSGVAIYKYFAESDPEYKSHLEVISHFDFHFEPRGGGMIENHLFCGQDNIFKSAEDLEGDTRYNQDKVALLKKSYQDNGWKDNWDYYADRNNRFAALGQNPETHNYVGQSVIKLAEWYTTYKGKRYYVLFNEQAQVWVRLIPLAELFPDELWPYVCWHTNEDPDVFLSKAPVDDARPIARIINTMVNQELYNRQKRNYGQRGYDPEMFPNLSALADWRPDGLVPVDTKTGTRRIDQGVYEFKVGDLNGTLDLVTWLDGFIGKQTGNTPSSMGVSEKDKKVGVFRGEIEQIERLIGVKNKSYQDALSRLGLLFKQGLEQHLTRAVSVKIMGAKGAEWTELSRTDLKTESELLIQPVGGASELQLKRLQDSEKVEVLSVVQAVNPQWKDRQLLLLKGFTEEEVKDAFSTDSFAEKELMSEAAMSEKLIVEGKEPPLNRGATASFMQHIVDFATNADDLPIEIYQRLIEYAMAHTDIAMENMNRNIKEMIAARAKMKLSTAVPIPNDGIIKSNATGTPIEEIGPVEGSV